MIVDKDTFFNIINSFEIVPYTQSESWYEMHSQPDYKNMLFIVNDLENPTIALWGHIKKYLWVKVFMVESECFINESVITRKNIKEIYDDVANLDFDIIEVASNNIYTFEYEFGIRQSGFKRPLGQFSIPVTKHISLLDDLQYDRNWKKNLKKSKKFALSFEHINKPTVKDSNDFLAIYNEMIRRKEVGFAYSAQQIAQMCNTSSFQLFFVKLNEERICATLICTYQKYAGSLYAATGNKALKNSASFFMYSSLLNYLKEKNFTLFDVGKLVASKDAINSVFYFKNGMQGKHIYLNGEWAIYKNSFYRYFIYFLKKFIFKRREM